MSGFPPFGIGEEQVVQMRLQTGESWAFFYYASNDLSKTGSFQKEVVEDSQ